MSFWNLSDNTEIEKTGQFEVGGGNIEPMPSGTQVKAACDQAKWDSSELLGTFIELRWTVLAPTEYKNRKLFQKVKVSNSDPKVADKAKRMLAAIDANAGGGLMKLTSQPTDQDLQKNLLSKPMALKLQVWEMEKDDGSKMTGNWIQSVAPLNKKAAAPVEKVAPVPEEKEAWEEVGEDDIPF